MEGHLEAWTSLLRQGATGLEVLVATGPAQKKVVPSNILVLFGTWLWSKMWEWMD